MAEKEPTRRVKQIVGQYRQVVGAMEIMFQAAKPRTNNQPWRRDGVGSCHKVEKGLAETGLAGEAADELIRLRDELNTEYGGASTVTPCPYHRKGVGCVLGDLKSPICITWPDNHSEWRKRFGVDLLAVSDDAGTLLRLVLGGRTLNDTAAIDRFTQRVQEVIQRIEGEPRLEGGTFRERSIVRWRGVKETPRRLYNSWLWHHA